MKAVAQAMGVARSNLVERLKPSAPRKPRPRPGDERLLPLIGAIVAERATYGYRRVTALLNRQLEAAGHPRVNHKRIHRIMRTNQLLLPRYRGRRERSHDGVVITLKSNLRWCSDVFTIRPLLERGGGPGAVQPRLLRPRGDGVAGDQRRGLGRNGARL
jgi:putative transposase